VVRASMGWRKQTQPLWLNHTCALGACNDAKASPGCACVGAGGDQRYFQRGVEEGRAVPKAQLPTQLWPDFGTGLIGHGKI
jgi:hypothetical protein